MVLQFPGVEIIEINQAQQIGGPGIMSAAIAGALSRGRVNERTLVTSSDEYIQKFGPPDPSVSFVGHEALAFLKQGQQLFVTRVANAALSAGIVVNNPSGSTATSPITVGEDDPSTFAFGSYTNSLFAIFADNPGTWGNALSVRVANVNPTDHTFDIQVYITQSGNTSLVETWTVSRQNKVDGYNRQLYLESKINGNSDYIRVKDNISQVNTVLPKHSVTAEVIGAGNGVNKTFSATLASFPVQPGSVTVSDTVEDFKDDLLGNLVGDLGGTGVIDYSTGIISVTFNTAPAGGTTNVPITGEDAGTLSNTGALPGGQLVHFPVVPGTVEISDGTNTYTDDGSGVLTGAPGGSGTITYLTGAFTITGGANDADLAADYSYVNTITSKNVSVGYFFSASGNLVLGNNGISVNDGLLLNAWDLYRDTDEVDVRLLIDPGLTSVAVKQGMVSVASFRKDALAILVPPQSEQEASKLALWKRDVLNIDSSYAALYAPDVLDVDRYNNVSLYLPVSGYVAAEFVRFFNNKTPGTPIMGTEAVLNVQGIYKNYDDGKKALLYSNDINFIKKKQGLGFLIWGNETLQSLKSPIDRVHTRMLLIDIYRGLRDSLDYLVGKLNNEFTRLQARTSVSAFMQPYADSGDLDTSIDAGFKVKCDEQNNPPQIRQANRLIIAVGVKPSSAGEFVTVNLIIADQAISFDEVL